VGFGCLADLFHRKGVGWLGGNLNAQRDCPKTDFRGL